jgi:AraC-like DNA-binding protein
LIVAGEHVFITGPDTSAWRSTLASGTVLHGVRFHPGHAPRVLRTAASELRDQRVRLDEVWGRRGRIVTDRLLNVPGALPAVILETLAKGSGNSAADPQLDLLLARLGAGVSRVSDAMHDLDVGQRQLRRRFTAAVGYGPATYLRVARLQRARARAPRVADLSTLAAESGYADQAHLSRDCRDLTGMTAREYFVAGDRSAVPGVRQAATGSAGRTRGSRCRW